VPGGRALAWTAFAGAGVALAVGSCRAPTQITVVVTTDFSCADLRHVTVTVGTLGGALETDPPTSTSTDCANGSVGTIVVVPSGSDHASIGIKVVGGFGVKDAEECAPTAGSSPPDYGVGCIVARRGLEFTPYTPLTVPVVLRADCNGIACGETQTCVGGTCVSATVPDPSACGGGAGCSECALLDGGCPPATVYNDLADAKNWLTFDVTKISSKVYDFAGGAFDGRYAYFVPETSNSTPPGPESIVVRYDTLAPFATAASWSTFDASTLPSAPGGFAGAAFDGRYLYLVPYDDRTGNGGRVVRYDTRAAFGAAASWSAFDLKTVDAGAKGYQGATFDGRFVYFAPDPYGAKSIAFRYDTRSAFTAAASWSAFDTLTLGSKAQGFAGTTFDGRYVYLVPQDDNNPDGVVARFDTTGTFDDAASWSTFDTTTLDPNAAFFQGGLFDGRYVYLSPASRTSGVVTRYDTFASFGAATSWSTFDTTRVNAGADGYYSAGFDGRFVYFVPYNNGQFDSLLARYDTQASFGSTAAWSTVDTSTVGGGTGDGQECVVFDGRYLYFESGGHISRFDAKSPPSLPPGFTGSFY
jgi:hypothetical protein